MKALVEVIATAAVSQMGEENVSAEMIEYGQAYRNDDTYEQTKEGFERWLLDDEVEYMRQTYVDEDGDVDQSAVHQKGKRKGFWKMSLLPSKYRTARSLVGSCIEHGVKFVDEDGNFMKKSELSKHLKVAKQGNDTITAFEKAMKHARGIRKEYDILDPHEWRTVLDVITGKHE